MQLSIMDLEDRVMRWEIYEEEEKITHRLLWAPENPSLERGERERRLTIGRDGIFIL